MCYKTTGNIPQFEALMGEEETKILLFEKKILLNGAGGTVYTGAG